MMKLFLPDNIFSKIFLSEIDDAEKLQIEFSPSALISKMLVDHDNSLGLIPTLDVLTFKDLYISRELGISFNALLSNSYIHFKEKQKSINEIFLWGDVTTNEVILSKILLKEFYNVDVKTTLLSKSPLELNTNVLIVGDENFKHELFRNGLSFAEEIIELVSAPYVNFLLASKNEKLLKDFTSNYKSKFEKGHTDDFSSLFPQLPKTSLDFLKLNIQHLIFDFEEQDLEGVKLLMQQPFFHGILKNMIDVKFI